MILLYNIFLFADAIVHLHCYILHAKWSHFRFEARHIRRICVRYNVSEKQELIERLLILYRPLKYLYRNVTYLAFYCTVYRYST